MNTKKLLNWGALSRLLCGARTSMYANRIPLKHQPTINRLLAAMEGALTGENQNKSHPPHPHHEKCTYCNTSEVITEGYCNICGAKQ